MGSSQLLYKALTFSSWSVITLDPLTIVFFLQQSLIAGDNLPTEFLLPRDIKVPFGAAGF